MRLEAREGKEKCVTQYVAAESPATTTKASCVMPTHMAVSMNY